MKEVRVFAEVLPHNLGRVMYRINKYMKKYAPNWVTFTNDYTSADMQILDVLGSGSLQFKYCKNMILLQHCYLSAETQDPNFWIPEFSNAKLVATYMDLPRLVGDDKFNFLRMPWGVDHEVFYKDNSNKNFLALTTGYVGETESIFEVRDAIEVVNSKMIHIGGNLNLGDHSVHKEGVSDELLRQLYNSSSFVCGLRKGEGFELPILEGLVCGARGICFNSDHYKYWYGDLVEYIEEDNQTYSESIRDQLVDLFSKPVREVTQEEIEIVNNKFSWEKIFNEFWNRVEEII